MKIGLHERVEFGLVMEANTGVILVKNCETAKAILNEWWQVPLVYPDYEKYRYDELWFDQSCFNGVILPKYRDSIKLLPDYYLMNGHYGTFIRHLSGHQENYTAKELRKICERRSAFHKYLPLLEEG